MRAGTGNRLLREERGSVFTLVAVILPVLGLFFVLLVEVGNWFEHRRHLQLQADAGAFAGAQLFNRCFKEEDWASAETEIRAVARRFSGDPGVADRFNAQTGLGDEGDVTVLINSKTFTRGGFFDDSVVDDQPMCHPDSEMLDLKLTEADVPWFLRPAATLFAINAHARIEIQKLVELKGSLPVAIPDPNPRLAAIEFVNEGGGAAPCASPPCRVALADLGIDESIQMRRWGTPAPFRITVPSEGMRIGIRVNLGGELSTTCGQRLVECYDLGSSNGLAFIRGYSTGGSAEQPNAPLLRGAWPTTLTCNGPSFFWNPGGCSVGVEAGVDFGTGAVDPSLPSVDGGVLGQVEARVAGGAWVPMTWSGGVWSTSPGAFGIGSFAGPQVVDIRWSVGAGTIGGNVCTTDASNPCTGTFLNVQRVFSGHIDRSGSVRAIAVSEGSGSLPSAYSLPPGEHDLSVQVGTTYFHPADPDNPDDDQTVYLRAVGGSQSYAIDCDRNVNFRNEIKNGCATPYQLNPNLPGCPVDRVAPVPDNCVLQQTGAAVGQLRQGMNDRFGCPPNNWDLYPDLPQNDIRIVPLILTDFGAFTGSGSSPSQMVAVRRFANFYVTGWDGGQSCAENEPYAFSGTAQGNIWGHFIRQIAPPNFGRGDPNISCDFLGDDLDICIAVLTR